MKLSMTKDLDALRADALRRVDVVARQERAAIVGPSADIHAMKLAEARAYLAGADAGPLLEAEADGDVAALAGTVIAKAAATAATLAAIEVDRQARQAAIRTATTPAAIDAATQP